MLGRCLDSLNGIDEIVVLDTGSTDKTCEIARKYTDKVYEGVYTWNDNFAEARNKALTYSTTDWVLTIDADEYLYPNSLELIRSAIETTTEKAINMKVESKNSVFYFPRVYKRDPEVYWKGAVHNHLNVVPRDRIEAMIHYDYSPAHKLDPDRAFRILSKVVSEGSGPREIFYLAREYMYRKDWKNAIKYYQDYLKVAVWAPEMAEAWYQLARALWGDGKVNEAKDACLQSLKINNDYIDAICLMASLSGPKNKKRWLAFAELAKDEDVLFGSSMNWLMKAKVKDASYYNALFDSNSDMSRYHQIYEKVAQIATGSVLDICCGVGALGKYIENYKGFDFSESAVKIANDPRIGLGDAYRQNLDGFDTYIILEALEHLEGDIELLERIPKGKSVIFSVPSFADPSHIRTFTEQSLRERYEHIVSIESITRYNWTGKWVEGGPETKVYILLVKGKTK